MKGAQLQHAIDIEIHSLVVEQGHYVQVQVGDALVEISHREDGPHVYVKGVEPETFAQHPAHTALAA